MSFNLFLLILFSYLNNLLYSTQPVEDWLEYNEQISEPYFVQVCGKKFWVYPQNFGSQTFPDTVFYAQNIPIGPNEKFLEIGSGTGIISVEIALKTQEIVKAVDINPYAVANTAANAELHGVSGRLNALEGDLFSSLSPGDRFDVIFFNVPALDTDKERLTRLEQAIYDPGYRILERYLEEAPVYLAPKGRLFVGYSPIYGNFSKFRDLAHKNGYRLEIVAQDQPFPNTMFELVKIIISKEVNYD